MQIYLRRSVVTTPASFSRSPQFDSRLRSWLYWVSFPLIFHSPTRQMNVTVPFSILHLNSPSHSIYNLLLFLPLYFYVFSFSSSSSSSSSSFFFLFFYISVNNGFAVFCSAAIYSSMDLACFTFICSPSFSPSLWQPGKHFIPVSWYLT
jgi:hypothetical protein